MEAEPKIETVTNGALVIPMTSGQRGKKGVRMVIIKAGGVREVMTAGHHVRKTSRKSNSGRTAGEAL